MNDVQNTSRALRVLRIAAGQMIQIHHDVLKSKMVATGEYSGVENPNKEADYDIRELLRGGYLVNGGRSKDEKSELYSIKLTL